MNSECVTTSKVGVALNSVLASFALTVMKLVVGIATGSMGILSEAAHSLLDMGAAALTYFAVRVSDKPADREHPYGHGKIESISALAETALLFVTSVWIIYEAVRRIVHNELHVEVTWYAFAVIAVSIVIDYSRSRALMRVARATKSQALEADALHFRSDIWSSGVVLLGLLCVSFGMQGADSIAAMGVALFVMKVGYDLGRRTFDVLVDAAPEGVISTATDLLLKVPDVLQVERLRARTMGAHLSIEAIIHVSASYHGQAVAEITERAERALHELYPDADLLVHARHVRHPAETLIDRVYALAGRNKQHVHNVSVEVCNETTYILLDLEVPGDATLADAHARAHHFARDVSRELGPHVKVSTHLDPISPTVRSGHVLDPTRLRVLTVIVQDAARTIAGIHGVHAITGRTVDGRLVLSVHCKTDGHAPLNDVHEYAELLEQRIKSADGAVARVHVHLEPLEC